MEELLLEEERRLVEKLESREIVSIEYPIQDGDIKQDLEDRDLYYIDVFSTDAQKIRKLTDGISANYPFDGYIIVNIMQLAYAVDGMVARIFLSKLLPEKADFDS